MNTKRILTILVFVLGIMAVFPLDVQAGGVVLVDNPPYMNGLLISDPACAVDPEAYLVYFWFREDPPPEGWGSASVLEGQGLYLPFDSFIENPFGLPQIWNYRGDVLAFVWQCNQVADLYIDGEFNIQAFTVRFFDPEDSTFRDIAYQETARFKWEGKFFDLLWLDNISAKGEHLKLVANTVYDFEKGPISAVLKVVSK
jgi:hypothetical protein